MVPTRSIVRLICLSAAFWILCGRVTPPSRLHAAHRDGAGRIAFRLAGGDLYRISAQEGAVAEDVSMVLNNRSLDVEDDWLNISAGGGWLLLSTGRFDRRCYGFPCLALLTEDLSTEESVLGYGELIHPEGFGAVSPEGSLIVYPAPGPTHRLDLWAVLRKGDGWENPILLTADSPYAFNHQPAISGDGNIIVFDCGNRPYGAEGTALCEVGIRGKGFRVVLTPAGSPPGLPKTGALHHPGWEPDGSIVFEADWAGEQLWRLPRGATTPVRVSPQFGDDNSPCVLPDGRIASLWLGRPGNVLGNHELKLMPPDGRSYVMLVIDRDVADVGIGCGF